MTTTLQPDAPIGCPRAIAPPFTFIISNGIFKSLATAKLWAANASLDSIKSKSEIFQSAILSAFFDDGIGPDPIKDGSTPQEAQDLIFASGSRFLFSASLLFISKTAAAPSLIPEELPGVTVPFFLNAGSSFDKSFISGIPPYISQIGETMNSLEKTDPRLSTIQAIKPEEITLVDFESFNTSTYLNLLLWCDYRKEQSNFDLFNGINEYKYL